jgi:hypothetical protein
MPTAPGARGRRGYSGGMARPDRLDVRALLAGFEQVEIRFAVGRYVRWHPRLMARVQVFSARKPRRRALGGRRAAVAAQEP